MNKDLNEKISMEIGSEKPKNQEYLEKNNTYKNINFSNVSTKEATTISSETEESFQGNKNNKKNALKENISLETKNNGTEIYYILKEKDPKKNSGKKKIPNSDNYKSEYLSQKNIMNLKAPKVPINYNQIFNINKNTTQKEIGDKEYIEDVFKDKYKKNEEFKEISVISHDKLLHLITNENMHSIKESKSKYNEITITERFRHKYLTTVYFFPKK